MNNQHQPSTINHQPFFSLAIIPHTFSHTNFKSLKVGDKANLEFDVFGKYIQKNLMNHQFLVFRD